MVRFLLKRKKNKVNYIVNTKYVLQIGEIDNNKYPI